MARKLLTLPPADSAIDPNEELMANRFSTFVPRLWANWITLLGSVVTTISGLTLVLLFLLELGSREHNPYASSVLILALPLAFLVGLVLIPIGLWIDRRARAAAGDGEQGAVEAAFRTALAHDKARNRILFVAVATIANIVIFGLGTQHAVHYMDSPQFCGTTCHTVMQPEWESYNDAKHSRVACVQCHIGPGAKWMVKSKINGLKQVWGIAAGDYHRPVPSPVEHLRPSRDTCEQCHWPEKFTGNRLRVYPHYKADKDNTPIFNATLLRVGGRNAQTGKYEGIHWHVSRDAEVRYEVLDERRLKVGKIQVFDKGKMVAEYQTPEANRSLPVKGVRTMDCVDCHNRATHVFDLGPSFAVDRAMYAGELDPKTPWLAKVAASLLARTDVPRDRADGYFRKALEDTYAREYPDVKPAPAVLDRAATAMAEAWRHNNYPAMKITWGTHKTHLGHRGEGDEVIGCYRCHDDQHEKTLADGSKETLSQGCETCHEPLAADEDPAKFDETLQAMVGHKE